MSQNVKIILAKASDVGPMGRGQAGKKKIYEITVVDNTVKFSWGMAEKSQRQVKVRHGLSHQHALAIANEKKFEKVMSGYEVVLVA